MKLKEEIEKLAKDLTASVGDEYIEVSHPNFLFDYGFNRTGSDKEVLGKSANLYNMHM